MKSMKRRILLFALMAMLLAMSVVPASAAATATLAIDGKSQTISSSYGTPYIDSADRLLVPVRVISEKLGETVAWDGKTQTATIDGTIKVKLGSNTITTAYGTIIMDTKAVMKNNRIYVPIKYVGSALGYDVESTVKDGKVTANVITETNLTISAAASLKDALAEVQALYLKEKPNTKLTVNLGGSGTLQQQIEQGADVDLFFSASTTNMTTLKDKGLLNDTTLKNLLRNKVVLVVPNDSTIKMDSFADVTTSTIKKVALGEPKTVPAGQYAEQVFTYLNILDAVKEKVVYGKDVKEVLAWVETGNVDAGVVYSTDAMASTKVKVIATATEASHKAIIYPAAVIKATKHAEASKDFLHFLNSDAAETVFAKWGFGVL